MLHVMSQLSHLSCNAIEENVYRRDFHLIPSFMYPTCWIQYLVSSDHTLSPACEMTLKYEAVMRLE